MANEVPSYSQKMSLPENQNTKVKLQLDPLMLKWPGSLQKVVTKKILVSKKKGIFSQEKENYLQNNYRTFDFNH